MRVLLADGHKDVRWALRTVLAEHLGETTVAECADADELMSAVDTFLPDLILLDWELPGWTGAAQLARLQGHDRLAGIVVFCRRPELEPAALAAGADVCISKATSPEQLLAALSELNWSELARGVHEPIIHEARRS
jgi:DNA-binding NarL/FixJ family response regulator